MRTRQPKRLTRYTCLFCGYSVVHSYVWEGDCPRCGHGSWVMEDLPVQMELPLRPAKGEHDGSLHTSKRDRV